MDMFSAGPLRTALVAITASLWWIGAGATNVDPGATGIPIVEEAFDINPIAQQTPTPNLFFSASGFQFKASVDDIVHRQPDGTLVFETKVTIQPVNPSDQVPASLLVDQVSRTNYTGFSTSAIPEPDRGGVLFPETADRSASGSEVFFNFLNGSAGDNRLPLSGAESSFFAIATNATDFALTGALRLHVAGGDYTLTIPVFSPVPEPGQIAFLLAGGTVCVLLSRRRRPVAQA